MKTVASPTTIKAPPTPQTVLSSLRVPTMISTWPTISAVTPMRAKNRYFRKLANAIVPFCT